MCDCSEECQVTINNTGKEPVEKVEIILDSKLQPGIIIVTKLYSQVDFQNSTLSVVIDKVCTKK